MIVKKTEKEHFIYIFYKREAFEDFTSLKQMIEKCLCKQTDKRDIIIDLQKVEYIDSAGLDGLIYLQQLFQKKNKNLSRMLF